MRHLRKWVFPDLVGFDEEEETSEETEEEETSETEETSEEEEEEEEDKDPAKLKSALQKERKARRDAAKQLKELQKFKEEIESQNKTELERAQEKATQAEQKAAQLEEKYNNKLLDFAIAEAARKARFRDTDDALRGVDRSDLEISEDGGVDNKAVEKAVKALAEAKPHYVLPEGEELPPSGSKFGGKKKDDKKATEEQLKQKYPALSR